MHWFVLSATLLISWVLTAVARRYAVARQLLDLPNARSSHFLPTPRGGGVAIVVAASLGFAAMAVLAALDLQLLLALTLGGLPIAVVGFLDDHGSLSVRARIAAHLLAAVCAIWLLGGLPPIRVGDTVIEAGLAGSVLGVLGIAWSLNLFNFMDGIDGVAASEAIFVAAFGAGLSLLGAAPSGVAFAAAVIAAAAAGFLAWNWPPAKIFMGDVGSGYLGYVLAVLAIADGRQHPDWLFVWLILGAVFFVDATATLIRRLWRGERAHEAHRSHAYQVLARRLGSHRKVTVLTILVNVCVLFPLAWLAARQPKWGWLIAVVVYACLWCLVLRASASEPSPETDGRR